MPYIIENLKVTTIAVVTNCPAKWSAFEFNCYKVFYQSLSHEDAESFCQGEGGHLASIHSEEENMFVGNLSSGYLRLGATDKVYEGIFKWTDGSPFDFTSWFSYQPDDLLYEEDCVITNYGKPVRGLWNDVRCRQEDYIKKFVCKK